MNGISIVLVLVPVLGKAVLPPNTITSTSTTMLAAHPAAGRITNLVHQMHAKRRQGNYHPLHPTIPFRAQESACLFVLRRASQWPFA
jgi:hypothetical protein